MTITTGSSVANGNVNTTGASTPTSNNSAASASDAASSALSQNYQDFLKLLTTQLQNQDPTNPLDTNQMTQQIAQLSQVEQQIATNKNLTALLAAYNSTQTGSAVSYIGQRVEATGNTTGLQNGMAQLVYTLDSAATSATITIKDSNGNVVFSDNSPQVASGRNVINWNGLNSITGQQSPDGAYTYTVTAKDSTGSAVKATTFSTGQVTAVNVSSGTSSLQIGNGDFSIPLSTVTKIEPDALAQTAQNSTTNTTN